MLLGNALYQFRLIIHYFYPHVNIYLGSYKIIVIKMSAKIH
nr:MAG TPA: hypothetical protein [Caudoviricetes sp.]